MVNSDPIKLAALDEEDLAVISAHVQDAVFKVGEIRFDAARGQVLIPMNRFAWEKAQRRRDPNERRRSVLQFDRVRALKTQGIDRAQEDRVLSLLAVLFAGDNAPSGAVTLVCSGESGLRLEVECIEARLTDLGAAWSAGARPKHVTGA